MLILKMDIKDMEPVGGLPKFIDGVFLNRNWDLFLTLCLKGRKGSIIELIKNGTLKSASEKVKILVSVEPDQKELNDILIKNGISPIDLRDFRSYKVVDFDLTIDYLSIDNLLYNILDFEKSNGLIPTIVQDHDNNVLMLAYSSRESLECTIKTKKASYFSRSRNKLWIKGETSGNSQIVTKMSYDCDADALLFRVKQKGVACHTGAYSCFQISPFSIRYLYDLIGDRIKNSEINESYTKRLSEDDELLFSKIQEESLEVINFTDRENLIWEISDLTYFILVLMVKMKIDPIEIIKELGRRNK